MVRSLAVFSAIFCATTMASAQTPREPSTPAAPATQDQQVTVTGCVVREADYRASVGVATASPAGTAVGAANEFVLTSLFLTSPAAAPSGTVGTAGVLITYELTGSGEANAAPLVGQRVEISGVLKAAKTDPAGPTAGPTAGTPSSGIDATSRDLKLRELEVTSIKAASGICPRAPAR
jgi:hypothetical protein